MRPQQELKHHHASAPKVGHASYKLALAWKGTGKQRTECACTLAIYLPTSRQICKQ